MSETGNGDNWARAKALFAAALEQPVAERETFLLEAAGDDVGLADSVRALLEASYTEDTMDSVVREAASDIAKTGFGAAIDNYAIETLLGEGGMGDVYLANRSDGSFQQKVAIKMLRSRRPHDELRRRFEAERQILASLEHPNIARLIDGGETSSGAPYLVMEYVDGKPITEYCDEHRLGIRDRLDIFLKVCAAVQQAHQNLIIHRDIKPGNILVSTDGEPKLLDFGIAKLLDANLMQRTVLETVDSARLMTPRHASPEQIRGHKITVATDIYSLGVLLYELLSGLFPYELTSNRAAEVEQAICDTDPAKPSTRLTHGGDASIKTIAAARQSRLADLARQIGGDLDTIILKAMQKDPGRRYATAGDLADDIKLYLQYKPVAARPDSLMYRTAKFVRRNRFAVGVASMAASVVVITTALAFSRVAAERDLAETERQKAEAINGFMQGIFAVSDPEESRGEAISARDLLEEGARRIRTELAEQPDTQATMMRVLGDVYYNLGDWDSAETQMQAALDNFRSLYGEQHAEVANAKMVLGLVAQDLDDLDDAALYFDETLETRERLFGRAHFATIEAISARAFLYETTGDYVKAEAWHTEALALANQVHSGDHEFTAELMAKLAGIYRILGRNDQAEPLLIDALAMQDRLYGGQHPKSSDTKRQLAGLYRETGRFAESETLYKAVIDERVRMLGSVHKEVANTWNSYAQLLDNMGKHDQALDAYQTAIDLMEQLHNGPHPSFGALYNNFAVSLRQSGRYDEALEYYQLSIDMQNAVELPARHPNRSFPLGGLASTYLATGRYQESAELAATVLDMRREHFPENHRVVSEVKNIRGAALIGLGNYTEAEQWLLDAYSSFLAEYGESHKGVSQAAFHLAELEKARGNSAAERRWRAVEAQALAARRAAEGEAN